ncbi:predicted protein [Methanosarcina acetivorans C2A]|uniref:Uncharacterized protein n=1 Tax=Methanosarcina acetivorans (strain ATCC 35395 / DSM 2834 / JCM 12185 / C2A) TaxID=188937 RepID=Q8TQE9_METAC|nr:predicted protein [Methanosarcina acetivorans C2A]
MPGVCSVLLLSIVFFLNCDPESAFRGFSHLYALKDDLHPDFVYFVIKRIVVKLLSEFSRKAKIQLVGVGG